MISVLVASLGNRSLDLDSNFLKTFPDIDKVFPNTRFEFPDKLETTDPQRVGSLPHEQVSDPGSNLTSSAQPAQDGVAQANGGESEDVGSETLESAADETGPEITGYVLQAGAFSQRRAAEAFRASLLLEGHEAYIKEHQDESEVARYRVIVGPYENKEDSSEDIARLRQRNISAFLVPMTEESP